MKRLVLILLFVLTGTLSYADHMMGANISYTNIGNRKWKITLKVTVNCETSLALCNSGYCSPLVTAKPNQQLNPPGAEFTISPRVYNLYLTKVKIEDINQLEVSQLGSIAKNNCTNMGQQTAGFQNPSWEVFTFEGVLDLSSPFLDNTICKYWDLSYTEGIRVGPTINNIPNYTSLGITTTFNIYHKSTIAEGLKCNSPQLKNHPLFRAYSGNQLFYNPAAIDSDGDSLNYFIGQAYEGPNMPISYTSPFSNTYPFPLNQTAEPHISYPQGINPYLIMDGTTGTLSFNPVNNSANSLIGSIVIGIKQWSKDTLGNPIWVGVQEYEFPVMVINNQGNNGIILKNTEAINNSFKTAYSMLPTDTLVVNITAKDPDINATSTRTDTTKIIRVFMSDSVNTFITHTNGTFAQDAITIKYAPGIAKLNTTQTFTVLAVDNNFPMQMSSRQFNVRVVDGVTSANIAKTIDNCGQVTLSYYNPINVKNVVWDVCTTPNQFTLNNQALNYTNSGPVKLPPFSAIGKYLVRLTLYRKEPENATPVFVYDTIVVNKPTYYNPIKDTTVCANTPVAFTVLPGNYLWTARHKEQQFDTTGNTINDTVYANTVYYVSGTITDSSYAGCVLFDTATVWVNITPETHLSSKYALCNNASVTLKATAHNTDSVAYLWSNNATDSVVNINQLGTYWVTLTNLRNGCARTKPVQIISGTPVNLIVPKHVTACQNDSIKLYANGAENYIWEERINQNNVIVSQNLSYLFKANQSKLVYVTGTSNNPMYCANHDTVFLSVIPQANLTQITGNPNPGHNTLVTYHIDSNPNYTITWQVNGGQLQSSTQTTATVKWNVVGLSSIKATAQNNNCADISITQNVHVFPVDGIDELITLAKVLIYPNPAHEFINLDFTGINKPVSITLLDNALKELYTQTIVANNVHQITTESLSSGLYFIKVTTGTSSKLFKVALVK